MQSGKLFNASIFHKQHGKPIGLLALVCLIFFEVAGGPFGVEQAVRAGGPFYALLGFIVFPIFWSMPEAYITAELCTAFPEASGFVAWVTTAYGDKWGFMKGYLSWLSGVTDTSLYPILFLDYLVQLLGPDVELSTLTRWLFILTSVVMLTYLNYRGVEIVGQTAVCVCVLALLPFAYFVIVGSFKCDPSRWLQTPEGGLRGVDWRTFLNVMFWNLNYWDSAASFAGEVRDPGVTFPRAMTLAIVLVIAAEGLPVLIGTGVSQIPFSDWTDGTFERVAGEISGPWLSFSVVLAAAISNIGMFEAELSSDSLQVSGMAERGILPKVLAERNSYGTPTYGILLSCFGAVFLGYLTFRQVVELLNLLYCFSQFIEFSAFLELRRKFPNLHRPYRIPLGYWGLCAMLTGPFILLVVIICLSSVTSLVLVGVCIVLGFLMFHLLAIAKENQWMEFQNQFETLQSDVVTDQTGELSTLVVDKPVSVAVDTYTDTHTLSDTHTQPLPHTHTIQNGYGACLPSDGY